MLSVILVIGCDSIANLLECMRGGGRGEGGEERGREGGRGGGGREGQLPVDTHAVQDV